MRIDPSIRALRGDPAAQRNSQAAAERAVAGWRAMRGVAPALAELERYGAGAPIEACPALSSLTADLAAARAFVAPAIVAVGRALAEQPLAHVPFRHQVADGFVVLQLARAGRAVLSLVQYAPPAEPAKSVSFAAGERLEICLDGYADARRVTRSHGHDHQATLNFTNERISPGSTAIFAGRHATKIVDRIDRPLTLLRLSRAAEAPLPSLEYRLVDGALVHRAAGACRESRDELMLSLLGRMGRRDAAPAMLARVRGGSASLRWHALRECLVLDGPAGFGELERIAQDRADPLSMPAEALRRDLRARYPQLASPEPEPCPA